MIEQRPGKSLSILLSMIGPAWLIFLTPSIALFLNNQSDLNSNPWILWPFMVATLIYAAGGYALYLISIRAPTFAPATWFYLFSGPIFLILLALRQVELGVPIKAVIAVAVVAVCIAGSWKISRIALPDKAFGWTALAATAFVLLDVGNFVTRFGPDLPRLSRQDNQALTSPSPDLPNIYHFVFDEYQSDMFELTMSADVQNRLGGFTFFADTAAVFGRTGMSLPTIFTGRNFDFQSPQLKYQKDAFGSSDSLLYVLKKAGFVTEGYLHPVYSFVPELFDYVSFHPRKLPGNSSNVQKAFLELWQFSILPSAVSRRLLGEDQFLQFLEQNVLVPAAPIISYNVFQHVLNQEETRGKSGRYVFVHLLVPHFPNVLDADCESGPEVETGALEQSRCATDLMVRFIDRLKELGRFDNSVVVFQSDHGAWYAVEENTYTGSYGRYSIEAAAARSRSLLLVKIARDREFGEMELDRDPASLLDVAPTILGAVGLSASGMEGVDLFDNTRRDSRERFYHFYEKEGENEWTSKMDRYRVTSAGLESLGPVQLRNNTRSTDD